MSAKLPTPITTPQLTTSQGELNLIVLQRQLRQLADTVNQLIKYVSTLQQ